MTGSCEFEFMEYVDEDSIDPHLICSICHKPLKEPVCTPCDHTYGRACITHWLTQDGKHSCPVCVTQPLATEDLTRAIGLLRGMLDQLRVRCTLCEQTGLQRGNFIDHMNKFCPKATILCKAADIKCPWKGTRDELDHHVSECIFEPLRPVLAALLAENQRLIDQVQEHDHKIEELTRKMSQLNGDDSSEESDDSAIPEVSTHGNSQNEEDAVYVRNLPAGITFKELFDLFSKVGRIKFNSAIQKPAVFIFRNQANQDSARSAKITYIDKEAAAAAIAEYHQKHIPQWKTRILVSKFRNDPKRKNVRNAAKSNHENASAPQNAPATASCEATYSGVQPPQSSTPENSTAPKHHRRGRKHPSDQGNKMTSEN